MLFNSLEFVLFFPLVIGLYFLLPHRYRWLLLLVASYIFYMFWRVEYALILVTSTLIDYSCGRMMGRYSEAERSKRKPWLWLSLLSNLGILFAFKYFNFFSEAASGLAYLLGMQYATPAFELLLPMGISFYTFQTMSYSIDVYYDRIKPEKHLGIFALFVTFFPQLVAGPIERAGNLLNQLRQHNRFEYQRVSDGLKLMAWGFFKKLVIADQLAVFVNQVYEQPQVYTGLPLITATIFFAFQIYCDFSGYCDIAIGTAQVLGIRLMQNFRTPYFSGSIKEFWSRWHISLSTWFRDYLYIPLGGNRVLKWRWYYNLFVVFLLSGLWHGANWTFLVWGALHGLYLVMGESTAELRANLARTLKLDRLPRLHRLLQIATTFCLVCLAWIFFRANSLSDAWYITTHMFAGLGESVQAIASSVELRWELLYLSQPREIFIVAVAAVLLLLAVEATNSFFNLRQGIELLPTPVRITFYGLAGAFILLFGSFTENEFIYFQF